MSRAWAEAHDVTTPADFVGAREETYASRHANGTGPFVLESFEPRGGWVMVRNPDWWGTADYPHNIDRIVHVPKADPENVAALLDGEIDLLQTVPYWALDQIRSHPELKLAYQAEAAHDVLRPRSGQRRAALVQHQGAQPVQGQTGARRPWPTPWT